MLGFDDVANDVRELKALHDKAIAPKKRRASKPRIPLKMLRLTITEGKRTSTLELDEKKAEAWMKAKLKDDRKSGRAGRVVELLNRKDIVRPTTSLLGSFTPRYYDAMDKYMSRRNEAINEAELNFEISIETL